MIFLCVEIIYGGWLYGSGLCSSFVELRADNLCIGETYNLTEQANYPICITNTSNSSIWLKIKPTIPDEGDLRVGYEPIPSTAWVNIEPMVFNLESNEQAIAHLTLTIPNDARYLGKRYQVGVLAHTIPAPNSEGVGISYGLLGRLLFSISPELPTSKLQIYPQNVKPQKELLIGNVYPISLHLKNTLAHTTTCTMAIYTPQQLDIPIEVPYKEPLENTVSFIIPSEKTLSLPPNATITTTLYVAFPEEPSFIGDWAYTIYLELLEYNLKRYIPLYLKVR